jgi:hypothetical protein
MNKTSKYFEFTGRAYLFCSSGLIMSSTLDLAGYLFIRDDNVELSGRNLLSRWQGSRVRQDKVGGKGAPYVTKVFKAKNVAG